MDEEMKARVVEVLDLASSADIAYRYGFPESAYGSDKPEMAGVVFGNKSEDGKFVWKHVPRARLWETTVRAHLKTGFGPSEQGKDGYKKITMGEKTWEMSTDRWNMMQSNARAAQDLQEFRGFSLPENRLPVFAKITRIVLGTSQYASED